MLKLKDSRNRKASQIISNILKKSIEETGYEDEKFDLIICNDMLAYTDKRKSLSEIYRILKKDGYIISLYNHTIDWPIDQIIRFAIENIMINKRTTITPRMIL